MQSPNEPVRVAVHVDIELVPLAIIAVETAVARAGISPARSIRSAVALLDRAAAHNRLDAAGSDLESLGCVGYGPVADPKVELPIFRAAAGRCVGRGGLRRRGYG